MKGVCVVCGKRFYDMEIVPIAEGWRLCCRQLYPPLFPPRVPVTIPAEAPYQKRDS